MGPPRCSGGVGAVPPGASAVQPASRKALTMRPDWSWPSALCAHAPTDEPLSATFTVRPRRRARLRGVDDASRGHRIRLHVGRVRCRARCLWWLDESTAGLHRSRRLVGDDVVVGRRRGRAPFGVAAGGSGQPGPGDEAIESGRCLALDRRRPRRPGQDEGNPVLPAWLWVAERDVTGGPVAGEGLRHAGAGT